MYDFIHVAASDGYAVSDSPIFQLIVDDCELYLTNCSWPINKFNGFQSHFRDGRNVIAKTNDYFITKPYSAQKIDCLLASLPFQAIKI